MSVTSTSTVCSDLTSAREVFDYYYCVSPHSRCSHCAPCWNGQRYYSQRNASYALDCQHSAECDECSRHCSSFSLSDGSYDSSIGQGCFPFTHIVHGNDTETDMSSPLSVRLNCPWPESAIRVEWAHIAVESASPAVETNLKYCSMDVSVNASSLCNLKNQCMITFRTDEFISESACLGVFDGSLDYVDTLEVGGYCDTPVHIVYQDTLIADRTIKNNNRRSSVKFFGWNASDYSVMIIAGMSLITGILLTLCLIAFYAHRLLKREQRRYGPLRSSDTGDARESAAFFSSSSSSSSSNNGRWSSFLYYVRTGHLPRGVEVHHHHAGHPDAAANRSGNTQERLRDANYNASGQNPRSLFGSERKLGVLTEGKSYSSSLLTPTPNSGPGMMIHDAMDSEVIEKQISGALVPLDIQQEVKTSKQQKWSALLTYPQRNSANGLLTSFTRKRTDTDASGSDLAASQYRGGSEETGSATSFGKLPWKSPKKGKSKSGSKHDRSVGNSGNEQRDRKKERKNKKESKKSKKSGKSKKKEKSGKSASGRDGKRGAGMSAMHVDSDPDASPSTHDALGPPPKTRHLMTGNINDSRQLSVSFTNPHFKSAKEDTPTVVGKKLSKRSGGSSAGGGSDASGSGGSTSSGNQRIMTSKVASKMTSRSPITASDVDGLSDEGMSSAQRSKTIMSALAAGHDRIPGSAGRSGSRVGSGGSASGVLAGGAVSGGARAGTGVSMGLSVSKSEAGSRRPLTTPLVDINSTSTPISSSKRDDTHSTSEGDIRPLMPHSGDSEKIPHTRSFSVDLKRRHSGSVERATHPRRSVIHSKGKAGDLFTDTFGIYGGNSERSKNVSSADFVGLKEKYEAHLAQESTGLGSNLMDQLREEHEDEFDLEGEEHFLQLKTKLSGVKKSVDQDPGSASLSVDMSVSIGGVRPGSQERRRSSKLTGTGATVISTPTPLSSGGVGPGKPGVAGSSSKSPLFDAQRSVHSTMSTPVSTVLSGGTPVVMGGSSVPIGRRPDSPTRLKDGTVVVTSAVGSPRSMSAGVSGVGAGGGGSSRLMTGVQSDPDGGGYTSGMQNLRGKSDALSVDVPIKGQSRSQHISSGDAGSLTELPPLTPLAHAHHVPGVTDLIAPGGGKDLSSKLGTDMLDESTSLAPTYEGIEVDSGPSSSAAAASGMGVEEEKVLETIDIVEVSKDHLPEINSKDIIFTEETISRGDYSNLVSAVYNGSIKCVAKIFKGTYYERRGSEMMPGPGGSGASASAEPGESVMVAPDSFDERLKTFIDMIDTKIIPRLHPNLIRFYAYSIQPYFCLIMEKVAGGNFINFSRNCTETGRPVNQMDLLDVTLQVSDALEFLHSHDIIHKDVRAANILVRTPKIQPIAVAEVVAQMGSDGFHYDRRIEICLADFGLRDLFSSVEVDMNYVSSTLAYDGVDRRVKWMAPEVFGEFNWSVKSDVYSFGITFWELLTGREPYNEVTAVETAVTVMAKGQRPTKYEFIDKEFWKLMTQCWHAEYKERPEMSVVKSKIEEWLKHPPKAVKRAMGSGVSTLGVSHQYLHSKDTSATMSVTVSESESTFEDILTKFAR